MKTNFERISPLQAIFLASLGHLAIVLLWFRFTNQDVWISQLIALFYTAILCVPLLFLGKQYGSLTPIEYLPLIVGNLLGKVLGFFYAVFFLYLAIMDLSLFDNILKPINFPETPDFAIIVLALITCGYGLSKGLECIARTAEIFTPLILTLIVLYMILQIPEMDFKVFLPILADSSFSNLNSEAFNIAAGFNEIVILAMMMPYVNKKESPTRILFLSAVIITVFSLIIVISTLAGLGLDVPKKTFDPYYLFIKQINIYDFITRIEFLLVAAWNIGMFLRISLMLYLGTKGMAQVFGLSNHKVLILPLIIAIFLITLVTGILKSVVVFTILEKYVGFINLIFIFFIPVLVLIIFFLKKNRKSNTDYNT